MATPLFSPGDRVFHKGKSTYGVIQSVINESDEADVRAQGVRYELLHSGWVWSVPESSLRQVKMVPSIQIIRDRVRCG